MLTSTVEGLEDRAHTLATLGGERDCERADTVKLSGTSNG